MRTLTRIFAFTGWVIVAATAFAQPQYQIFDIGVVTVVDTASQGFQVSPGGIAVGRSVGTNASQAFTWTVGGGLVGLPSLAGRNHSVSNSANDNGIVVGTASTTLFGTSRLPVIWQSGVVSQLPLPAGETLGDAHGVNAAGIAVGSVDGGSLQQAVIYEGANATVITQTTATGCFFLTAFGINNSGRIVGQGIDPSNAARNVGIVYDIGSPTAFEVGAIPGANGALAFAVGNGGHVVGSSMMNQGSGTPFIWSQANGIVAIPLAAGTSQGSARAVNSTGWVVGQDSSAFSIPFLWDGTTTYRLADLLPPGSGWDLDMNTSSSALGISDDGIIVGTGVHNGATHGYAMVPVKGTPTPSPTPTPGPATHFEVIAPSTVGGFTPFNFTVRALDQFNNTATSYTGTVHFTASHSASLPPDSTLTNGFRTFSASFNSIGSDRTITATDTVNSSITGTSNNILVLDDQPPTPTPGPATHFEVIAPPIVGGFTPFNFTVRALDQSNNTATNYSGTVHFTASHSASLPADSTLTNGFRTFSASFNSIGSDRTITATDTVNPSITGTSNNILVMDDQPPTPTPTATPLPQTPTPPPPVCNLAQGFDDITTLPPLGWVQTNHSTSAGVTGWFQGNTAVFPSQSGGPDSYIAANFNNDNGAGTDTISNWLLTAPLTLENGAQMTFYTRTVDAPAFPDRMQVRLSTNGASYDVGTTATDVGDFTTLLLDINSTYTLDGYPNVWTQFTITVSGVASTTTGRLAFRYFVENAGPQGTNSDYIGIDAVEFTGICGGPTPTPGTPTPTPTITPSATPAPVQALNLSTRMRVQTGNNVGIGGFIIAGTGPAHVLVRAIGPSLTKSGVTDALADPVLELHGPNGFVTIINDNWRDDPAQEALILLTGIAPTNNLESAIDATLAPGAYTAVVRGNGNTSGVGLIEVYDLFHSSFEKLANISTRAFVETGNDVVIAGFILGGSGTTQIGIRGIGPSLIPLGVSDALPDPTLELRDSNGTLLNGNNNWQDDPTQAAQLTAAGLAPTNTLESGIILILPAGFYTAVLAGGNNGTGVGLVEIYDLGPPPPP